MPISLPRMYTDNAAWFHALTAPEDYAEEAEIYRREILAASCLPVTELLELGSGGGNNASHLKQHFRLTLVDLSPDMLAISQELNPECEHLQGDMRTVRLNRQFDAVFVHDAIMYMTSLDDLRQVIETAYLHCKPGSVALFVPDCVKETFQSSSEHGGHERDGRSMRYLEWNWDPDPTDTTFVSDFVYLIRQPDGSVRCEYERHTLGLYPRFDWLSSLQVAGFQAQILPFVHSEVEPGTTEIFIGVKPTT